MKFKVGDRVKIVKCATDIPASRREVGRVGTVKRVRKGEKYPYDLSCSKEYFRKGEELIHWGGGVRMKKPEFFITYVLDEDPYKLATTEKEMKKMVAELLADGATEIFVGEIGGYYEVTTPEKFELKEIK